MRVRGLWPYLPYYADRLISLPIQWQKWILDAPGVDGGDGGEESITCRTEYFCMNSMVCDYTSVQREIKAYEVLTKARLTGRSERSMLGRH